jgi:hypothetical protein
MLHVPTAEIVAVRPLPPTTLELEIDRNPHEKSVSLEQLTAKPRAEPDKECEA